MDERPTEPADSDAPVDEVETEALSDEELEEAQGGSPYGHDPGGELPLPEGPPIYGG